jgi:hypothetical protein
MRSLTCPPPPGDDCATKRQNTKRRISERRIAQRRIAKRRNTKRRILQNVES